MLNKVHQTQSSFNSITWLIIAMKIHYGFNLEKEVIKP